MLVRLSNSGFIEYSEPLSGEIPNQLTKRARLVYCGDFESMDGPVSVKEEHLQKICNVYNGKLAKLKRLAVGSVSVGNLPPVQLDHTRSARDTVGRLENSDLTIEEWTDEEGTTRKALYGHVRFLGKDNVERVLDGRWSTLSIGANFDDGKLDELSVTPFPAAEKATVLSRLNGSWAMWRRHRIEVYYDNFDSDDRIPKAAIITPKGERYESKKSYNGLAEARDAAKKAVDNKDYMSFGAAAGAGIRMGLHRLSYDALIEYKGAVIGLYMMEDEKEDYISVVVEIEGQSDHFIKEKFRARHAAVEAGKKYVDSKKLAASGVIEKLASGSKVKSVEHKGFTVEIYKSGADFAFVISDKDGEVDSDDGLTSEAAAISAAKKNIDDQLRKSNGGKLSENDRMSSSFKVGDKVQPSNGPLKGETCKVVKVNSDGSCVVEGQSSGKRETHYPDEIYKLSNIDKESIMKLAIYQRLRKYLKLKKKMSDEQVEEKMNKLAEDEDEEELKKLAEEAEKDEDKKEMSDGDDDEDKKKLSDDDDEDKKKLAEEEEEKKKDEMKKKMSAARESITKLSADFRTKRESASLAAKAAAVGSRLSAIRASGRITPAEVKKINVKELAGKSQEAIDAVLKTYEDRQPVIMAGQMGSLKAMSLKEIERAGNQAKSMSRLEAETRKNMSLLASTVKEDGENKAPSFSDKRLAMSQQIELPAADLASMEADYNEICSMLDGGKIPDAKARLKGFIESYKRLGAYGLAEPTMHEESMTQLAALQADLTELSSKFDEAMGLAASLAAGE